MTCGSVLLGVAAVFILRSSNTSGIGKNFNVILISVDTLSAEHMSAYQYRHDTTPNLSIFARDALSFSNALSQGGFTLPAHFSMLTGTLPARHQMLLYGEGPLNSLSPSIKTLAEYLKGKGYATQWIGVLGHPHLPLERGLGRGFDSKLFTDDPKELEQSRHDQNHTPKNSALEVVESSLTKLAEKNFFLFYHTYLVHSPYAPSSEEWPRLNEACDFPALRWKSDTWTFEPGEPRERCLLRESYDTGVLHADKVVGKILSLLKALGLYEKTIIVITSDHGEEFWEHGRQGHGWLTAKVLHVPLMIRIPGVRSGSFSEEVRSVDIVPTLLDYLRVEPLRDDPKDGRSLRSLIEGLPFPSDRTGYAYGNACGQVRWHSCEAIWNSKWKMILSADGEVELFDRKNDLKERINKASEHPEQVMELKMELTSLKLGRPLDPQVTSNVSMQSSTEP